ncbi:hypothetical protein HanIR_Chr11g0547311 [Helianthus annuus]|nr:hypothetical protein HanIR_Chr11g0547311 [Helianthus annuus]
MIHSLHIPVPISHRGPTMSKIPNFTVGSHHRRISLLGGSGGRICWWPWGRWRWSWGRWWRHVGSGGGEGAGGYGGDGGWVVVAGL